jgi:hypothetical protein
MAEATVVTFDLDFYAFSAWQLRETARQARYRVRVSRLQQPLDQLMADLDVAIPYLKDYRDMMVHSVDDVLDDLAWFGEYAGRLLPDGTVDIVIDARAAHHDALEEFFAGLIGLLEPLCSAVTKEMNAHALVTRHS